MPNQASTSPLRSLLSTANDIAVQLERYLRFPGPDHNPNSEIPSAADLSPIAYDLQEVIRSLRQWTISRMEIRHSNLSGASTSCTDHHYLVLEVSNNLRDCLQLRIDFTSCSHQLYVCEIVRVLQDSRHGSEVLDSELRCTEDFDHPPCSPSTPASVVRYNIFVTPIFFDFSTTDECIRRMSFAISDVDSIYERAENPEPVNEENRDFTLLSLAFLVIDSLKDLKLEEMISVPLCQTIMSAMTEVVRKVHQPWIENSWSSVYDNNFPYEELNSPISSYDRTSSDIDAECLLRTRRILELKLRLAIAELASACTDIKLFNLKNAAFAIGLSEYEGQQNWDHQILELLQAGSQPAAFTSF